MHFLVLEGTVPVRETLCYILLSFGIRGVPASTRQDGEEILARNPAIKGAIVDIDNKDVEGTEFIRKMAEDGHMPALQVIVHTAQSDKESVRRMLELGVAGYLLRPFDERTAAGKLRTILDRISDHGTQRRHIRVQPAADELIRVSFRLPDRQALFSGKIMDVSLGGMAIELFRLPEEQCLTAGTRIERLEMSLQNRQITPAGVVVACRGKGLAVRFEVLSVRDKPVLERYIFRRSSL